MPLFRVSAPAFARRAQLFLGVILLFILIFPLGATPAPAEAAAPIVEEKVPLWPLYYRAVDETEDTREILWPLWIDNFDRETSHSLRAVAWPLTRFSNWRGNGDFNHYVFPYFWGRNTPDAPVRAGLAPNRYRFLVPVYWWMKTERGTVTIIPPGGWARYPDGSKRYFLLPVFWRNVKDDGTFTVLTLLWFKTAPMGVKSGGIFPLVWWFKLMGVRTIVAVPGWYSSAPFFKTFGIFPLFWHNRTNLANKGKTGNTTYTNFLILGNVFTNPDGYLWTIFPLIRFSLDEKKDERFSMVFPFFYGRNKKHIYACTFPFAWSKNRKTGEFDNFSIVPLYWRFRDLGVKEPLPIDDLDAVFPLWGRNRGPGVNRSWSFILFPLFVKARHDDSRTTYFLYPLTGLKKQNESSSGWIFPLIHWSKTRGDKPSREVNLLLGFLMKWQRFPEAFHLEFLRYSMLLPPLIYFDKKFGSTEYKITALFDYKRTPDIRNWNVLLFVLRGRRNPAEKSLTLIMPIIAQTKRQPDSSRQWLMLLYYNLSTFADTPIGERPAPEALGTRKNILFPLWFFERRAAGQREWSLLDPLSYLRDEEDVQRHYSGLLHLVDYKRRADDSREFRLGWRLFHRRSRPGGERLTEFFPFVYSESAPERRRFSIGWKLFEYKRTGDRTRLTFLFIPVK